MADIARPVLIQYEGQNDVFEVASVDKAKEVHPDANIVAWAGSFEPYEKGEKPADPPPPVQSSLLPPPQLSQPPEETGEKSGDAGKPKAKK